MDPEALEFFLSQELRSCKSNVLAHEFYYPELYKKRNLVEWFFLKFKLFRRLFSRFDKKLLNFKAFLTIAETVGD